MATVVKDTYMDSNLNKAYRFFMEVEEWKKITKRRIAKYQAVIIGMGIMIIGLVSYIVIN